VRSPTTDSIRPQNLYEISNFILTIFFTLSLEHKNVIAFMSHCGQSGVYEAVATGTPVVTIPLFGDQRANAGLLLHRKVAVSLDYKTVTKDKVLDALNTIINDTR